MAEPSRGRRASEARDKPKGSGAAKKKSTATEPRASPQAKPRSETSSTSTASKQRRETLLAKLTYLTGGTIVGLVVGVFVGLLIHPVSTPGIGQPTLTPLSAGTSLVACPPPVAPRPAADIDLGQEESHRALRGEWTASAELDGRVVSVTRAAEPSLIVAVDPKGAATTITAVVRAVDVPPGQSLRLVPSVGETEIAKWTVGAEWSLLAAPWPATAPADSVLTLAVTAPEGDESPDGRSSGLALDHLLVTAAAAQGRLDLRTAEGRARLLAGFWKVEADAVGALPAVWTRGQRSTVAMLLQPTKGPYRLRLRAEGFAPIAPVEVGASINGRDLRSQSVGALQDYEFAVPTGAVVSGVNTIALEYSQTARPVDHGETDTRELSIRLFELELAPGAA